MKILFFIESLRAGGKERRLIELLTRLKEYKGIQFELVLTRSKIHYEEIHKLKIPIHIIERKTFQKDPRLFYKFYRIAKRVNPDLIHVWGNLAATYAIPAKLLLRIPMINNQIADAPLKLPNRILSYKLTFPFSNIIIANSKAGLETYNPPRKKSLVIYNGFDIRRLNNLTTSDEIRKNFELPTDILIAMVASFSEKKDYKTYIRAALLILKKYQKVTFLCVGSGNKKPFQEMVPSEFKSKILFIDAQEDILSLMNICDIGVLATYTEGISNAIMEFMALGKPVIATDGGGTKELIIDRETGFLVKRSSPTDLAEKMIELINNKSLRLKLGKNGNQRIINTFGIIPMIRQFVITYKNLLKND